MTNEKIARILSGMLILAGLAWGVQLVVAAVLAGENAYAAYVTQLYLFAFASALIVLYALAHLFGLVPEDDDEDENEAKAKERKEFLCCFLVELAEKGGVADVDYAVAEVLFLDITNVMYLQHRTTGKTVAFDADDLLDCWREVRAKAIRMETDQADEAGRVN